MSSTPRTSAEPMPRPSSAFGTSVCRMVSTPAVALVIREGDVAIGIEFEALTLGIVANGIGHGHGLCTFMI